MSMMDDCERCSALVRHQGDHLCGACAQKLGRDASQPFWGDFANHPDAKFRPTISAFIGDFAAVPPAIGRDLVAAAGDLVTDVRSAWFDFNWLRQL